MAGTTIDYASDRTPSRPTDPTRTAPLFAVIGGVFAVLKSIQYHGQGQMDDERAATLLFVAIGAVGLVVTAYRIPRYASRGLRHTVIPGLACLLALTLILIALSNHATAYGARRTLPF